MERSQRNGIKAKGSLLFSQSDTVKMKGVGSLTFPKTNESSYEVRQGTVSQFRNGHPEGILRHFGKVMVNKEHVCYQETGFGGLAFVCRYHKGKAVGPCWRQTIGGGFLYSMSDKFTGDDVAYIYPDLRLAMVGKFKGGVMVSAKKATVRKVRCNSGIMELEFSKTKETDHAFHFETLTHR